MFPFHRLLSLLPEGGQALAAGLRPELLQAWLEGLAGATPEARAAAVKEQLGRLSVLHGPRQRLRMLDLLAEETHRLTAAIEAELDRAHHPLPPPLQQRVTLGNGLLKSHGGCYRTLALQLHSGWWQRNRKALLAQALHGAMDMERRRLLLAHRAYAPGSKSAWRNLHRLYRLAREAGLGGEHDALRLLYLKTLLLAHAAPAQRAPGELDRVRFYLERHAALAELREAAALARHGQVPEEGCFLIRREEDGPGRSLRKWPPAALQAGDLLLDCGALLARLREQIEALERGLLPSKVGLPSVAHRPQYRALLRNLLVLWGSPPLRRHPRQQFRPRVELAAGLDELWALLTQTPPRRRREDGATTAAEAAVTLSTWSVGNESPTGFALEYLSGDTRTLSVGMPVGVRAPERSGVQICIVRRLVNGQNRHAQLGLEKYAPLAIPTTVGWGGSARRTPVRALVLPRVPALGGTAAVLAAPGLLRPGRRIPCVVEGRSLTYVTGTPLEHGAHHELLALERPE